MARALVVMALLLGAALRLYPLHRPFVHPDQELLPMQALAMLVNGDWRPRQLTYPSGFLYVLRASYAVMLGPDTDAPGLFVRFLADPFPFYVVARAWSCLGGIATIPLTAALATRIVGAEARGLAALMAATGFLLVRESHYGSGDAAATALFVATLLAAAAAVEAERPRLLVVAGVLAGLSAGFRYQLGVVALAVPVAVVTLRAPLSWRARAVYLGAAALAAFAAFAAVTPYSLYEIDRARADVALQLRFSYYGFGGGLSPTTAIAAGAGWVVCGLAALGLVRGARSRPALVALVVVVALPYAWALASASRSFARYTLPLLPLCAVFAAGGVLGLAGLAPPRWRAGVVAALVALALADPLGRAVAFDRLLARPDTRDEAAQWILAHTHAGDRVWVASALPHASPTLPFDLGFVAYRCGPTIAAALRPRLTPGIVLATYGTKPHQLAALRRGGGLVVAPDHPLLRAWAATPPAVQELLEAHATREVDFIGLAAERAPETLFDPIDANFLPLRGFEAVTLPGPNLAIWRLPPAP